MCKLRPQTPRSAVLNFQCAVGIAISERCLTIRIRFPQEFAATCSYRKCTCVSHAHVITVHADGEFCFFGFFPYLHILVDKSLSPSPSLTHHHLLFSLSLSLYRHLVSIAKKFDPESNPAPLSIFHYHHLLFPIVGFSWKQDFHKNFLIWFVFYKY